VKMDLRSVGIAPHVLNFETRWRRVFSFTSPPLYPRDKSPPGTHWTGYWLGPRAGLHTVAERKIPVITIAKNWLKTAEINYIRRAT